MINFTDDVQPSITLDDPAAKPILQPDAIQNRVQKIQYALGADAPPSDQLQNIFETGKENDLRSSMALNEESKYQQTKTDIVNQTIASAGSQLTPQGAKALNDFDRTSIRVDPELSIEKAVADKYTQDVVTAAPTRLLNDPKVQSALPDETDVLAGMQTFHQWLQHQREDLETVRANESYLTTAKNFALGLVPFLPWWRQAHALDRPSEWNFLPGDTIRDNIQYVYTRPLDERKKIIQDALPRMNSADQEIFINSLLSFSTSDYYIANAMGVADYLTMGLPVAGGIGRKMFGRAELEEPLNAGLPAPARKPAPTEYYKDAAPLKTETAPAGQQLDLFGEQPAQGSFRFQGQEQPPWQTLTKPDQVTPAGLYRKPSGQMAKQADRFETFGEGDGQYQIPFDKPRPDVNPDTGVFRGQGGKFNVSTEKYKTQGELPLERPPQQTSLDLSVFPKPPVSTDVSPQVAEVRKAMADAHKATEGTVLPKPEEVLSALGKTEDAGFLAAVKRLLNPFREGNAEVAQHLFSTLNPKGFLADSKVIGASRAAQLVPQLEKQIADLTGETSKLARVSRLTPEALQVAKAKAEDNLLREYGDSLNSAILDQKFDYIPAGKHPASVDTVVLKVGKPGGTLFDTEAEARLWARERYNLPEAVPTEQQGYGWHLSIPKHLDERDIDVVRAQVGTAYNQNNKNLVTAFLGKFRTAEDILAPFQRDQRQIAVHAQQEIKALLRSEIDSSIMSLPRGERKALNDMLTVNRDLPNPRNPSQRGFWYQTAGEYEQAFLERHNRLPAEREILAYDKYKRLQDWELLVENAAVYRDKARQGIEQHRYQIGANEYSPWFEGKLHQDFPWKLGKQDYDAGIWVHDSSTGQGKYYYKFNMTPDQRKMVDDLIQNRGYRVVQVADPKTHPLSGIAKTATGEDLRDQVNYVVTKSWDKKGLSWDQVDYREGPHSIYKHDWYVAQPVIDVDRGGKATYYGDNNILNIKTEAQARKWAPVIDKGRQLLRDGKRAELDTYLKENLPVEWNTADKFEQLFLRKDSPLSLDHPVVFKQANHSTIDTVPVKGQYPNLIDGMKNPHDMTSTMDKALLMRRDDILPTIREGMTAHIADAEQFDPFTALSKALNQRVRNTWMNDYKIQAVQQWIQDFKHVMNPNNGTLEAYPLHFLYKPDYGNVSASLQTEKMAAEAARLAIVNFLGSKSELGSALDMVKSKVLNTVYAGLGDGKMLDLGLSMSQDPVHFLRGIAFHSKLGLFNPIQLFVQTQTMFHSIAVGGPRNGLAGFTAAPLIRALIHNPDMIDTVAGVASKMGWQADHFKEMFETLNKTGLARVAGEAAMRDDAFDPKMFQGLLGRFLDAGAMFFNEGERMNRLTGFATAFREFKIANPRLEIGNGEIGRILRRADDLTLNMSRASNAAWQSGVWSIPTQFWSYNARLTEQLLGGRLTGAEKARVLATYSLIYGIPIGVGGTVGAVWPAYDSIKQALLTNGIQLHDDWQKVATDGLMNYAQSFVTGKDYNTAKRYGPGNNSAIKDFLDGDKHWNDLVFGASGTIVGDLIKAVSPFAGSVAGVVNGSESAALMPTDWEALFRNASSFDTAMKMYGILQYGQWQTKNGKISSNRVDGVDAMMVMMGLEPQHITDTRLLDAGLRDNKKAQDKYVSQAKEDFRRAVQAASENDWDAYESYRKRATVSIEAAGLSFQDRTKVYKDMYNSNKDYEDTVRWNAIRHASPENASKMFDAYSEPMK